MGTPTAIAYDVTNQAVWVAGSSGILQKFNAVTLASMGTTTILGTAHQIVYDPNENAVWVSSNGASGAVQKVNASTLAVNATSVPCPTGGAYLKYIATERAVIVACTASVNSADYRLIKVEAATIATSTNRIFYFGAYNSLSSLAYNSATNELMYNVGSSIAVNKISAHDFGIRNTTLGVYSVINGPESVLFDSVNNAIWVAGGSTNGKLEKYNAATGAQLLSNISLGSTPRGLSYDSRQNTIWVANSAGTTLQNFNAVDGSSALGTVNISGTCTTPTATAYDPTQNQIWVACYGNTKIQSYNAATGAVVSSTIIAGTNPDDIVYDSRQNAIWVAHWGQDIKKYNAIDGSLIQTITTTQRLTDLVYDQAQNSIWALFFNGSLSKYDAVSGIQIGATVVVTNGVEMVGIAYDSIDNSIWVGGSMTYTNGGFYRNNFVKFDAATMDRIGNFQTGFRIGDLGALERPIAFDSNQNAIWMISKNNRQMQKISASWHGQTGNFTSTVIDFSQNVSFTTLSWLPSTQSSLLGSNALEFQVATSSTSTPDTWNFVGPDGTASTYYTSSSQAMTSTARYVKYKAFFNSATISSTPILNGLTFNYTKYATTSELISSKYDSGSDANLISKVSWTATGTSTNAQVKIQIRVASTSDGLDSATWCGYNDAGASCTGNNYFEDGDNNILVASGHPLMSGSGHRYFQYRVVLTSDGIATPTFNDINIVYLVNARPEFTAPATASQREGDGLVLIDYSALDSDTTSTGACHNCVIPSFEVSLDDGVNWSPITAGLPATSTASTTILASTSTSYSVIWDAKHAGLDGIYATSTKIKITIDDKEGGANQAVTTTAAFVLDVKNPTYVGTGIKVIASTTPASLELNASDNSLDLKMCFSLNSLSTLCSPYEDYSPIATFDVVNPTAQVYAHFRDKFGNITTLNAITPGITTGMVVRDISDVVSSSTVYQEFLAWKIVTITPPSEFHKYHVWRSTDGGDYSEVASITGSSTNYYFDQDLSGGVTYAYKVTVEDTNGNVSKFSSVVSDTADGIGGTNTTPPTISNVEVVATTTQTATIEWDTNELANSTVHYSLDNLGYDQTAVVVTMVDNVAGLGRHRVVLTGLQPNEAQYYFSVESENAMGNRTIDDNVSIGYGFTTKSGPQISGVTANFISNSGATIIWNTTDAADTYVIYSTSSANLATYQLVGSADLVHEVGNSDSVTSHSKSLTELTLGTAYYYYVKSGIATDNNAGGYYSFTTAIDSVAPVITAVTSTIVTDVQALISWSTNELSDSLVEYGTSSGTYFGMFSDSNLSTNHRIVLSGLSTSTPYYYKVLSTDASGNQSSSTGDGFTTLETLSQESAVALREQLALLQGYASGTAEGYASGTDAGYDAGYAAGYSAGTTYGYNWGYASGTAGGGYDAGYIAGYASGTADGYATGTTYGYNWGYASGTIFGYDWGYATGTASCPVCATCSGGGGGSSSYIDRVKPVISAVATANSENGLVISWTTDKKSSSFVEYGKTSTYGKTLGQIDSVTSHLVTLDNLENGVTYHYRINSVDENGNLGQSGDNLFETLASASIGSESSGVVNDGVFMAAVNKALSLVSQMSSQVSVGALESALNSQYDLVRQLSDFVPAPMLGGEPKVTVTANNAVVTWSSDKRSNSLVAIAPDNSYDKTKGDNAYLQVIGNATEATSTHIVTLNNLDPETVYHYQVRSMSGIGSESKSGDFTFRTKSKQLEITNDTVERVSDQEAIFRWLTNIETDSAVKYTPYRNGVLAIDEAISIKSKAVTTLHEVTVNGFESGLTYQIELSGKDLTGKTVTKKIADFSSGQDDLPPTIYQVQTESALSQGKDSNVQTIISWLTNEPSVGRIYYKKGADQGDTNWEKTTLDTGYTKKHIVVITKFDPGTVYQFKIESTDSSNNIATSKIYTLLAPKQKESVFTVIINNFEDIFGWTKQIGQ